MNSKLHELVREWLYPCSSNSGMASSRGSSHSSLPSSTELREHTACGHCALLIGTVLLLDPAASCCCEGSTCYYLCCLAGRSPCFQALAIREMGSYVCELKRVGTGHGVFHFDRWVRKELTSEPGP